MADQIFDVAIIGAGPAGLSAALTARVRNKSVALFEHMDFSPKLQKAHAINNYPGLPATPGKDLMKQFADHALAAGPTLIKEKVTNVFAGDTFTLLTPNNTYEAKAVVLAIGVSNSAMLNGEKDLVGNRTCRKFERPPELRAARNTEPMLLQTYLRDTGEVLAYRQDGTGLVAWDRPRMRHATYIKPAAAWWTHPEDLECLK